MKNAGCVLGGALFLAVVGRSGPAEAELQWERTQFEHKAGPEEMQAAVDFKFRNAGDYPVTIRQVHSDCGCTTARSEKDVYQPGEEGKISTVFTFGQRIGLQSRNIRVETDDPRNPLTVLNLVVDIPILLKVAPNILAWKVGQPKEPQTVDVQVVQPPVRVVEVRSFDKSVISQVKVIEEGRRYAIVVEPVSTDFELNSMLEVVTDSPPGNPKVFPVHILVKQALSAPYFFEMTPAFLSWERGEESRPKTIALKVVRPTPIQITAVRPAEGAEDFLVSNLNVVQEGRQYQITMTPKRTDAPLKGTFRLTTTLPESDGDLIVTAVVK